MTKQLSKSSLVLILALGLLCAVLMLNGHLVPAGDNATYIVLGRALATGQGYTMVSDPRKPAMALYPPAYPLLLSGMLLLTGTANRLLAAIVPLKLLSIAFYLGAIVLAYDIFRRRNSSLAAIAALLMAVNPGLLYFSNEVGTEIPYLFFSLSCLWLFERYWQAPGNGTLVCLALLLAWTFYVRSITLVMVLAFGFHLLMRKRTRHALLLLVLTAVTTVPWLVHASSLPTTGTSVGLGRGYFALYFSSDPYGTARASLSDWVARLSQNLRIYGLEIWPDTLFPHASSVAKVLGPIGIGFLVAISALVALGFVLEARRRQVDEWYVALFFASCVGYLWAQNRLIVPIIPFAIFYLLTGVSFLLKFILRGQRRIQEPILIVGCLALALSALVADVRHIQRNLRFGHGQPVDTYYARDVEWSSYLQAMHWIAADATTSTVVMCRKADLLYILIGHQALEYPYSADGMELMRAVYNNRVAYVIEDAFTWTRTTQQYLQPALSNWQAKDPAALSLAYETDPPHSRVWRVTQQP